MTYRHIFAIGFALGLTMPVEAQRITTYEQLTVAATAIGITATTTAKMAGCSLRLEAAQIRFRMDGSAPTTTVGTLLEIGDVLNIDNIIDANQARFIRTGGTSGVLNINCWPN